MESFDNSLPPLKSALFVDFDNIFIGLSKSDPLAAERFASDPARWLEYLEKGLPLRHESSAGFPRRRSILVRRCYPNPDAGFRRFRSFFTSAAFTVIDCPTLTRTGKNSSDIYMVMDILDILTHKTHFDEFIIFSGDSDFMPVLLRLRAHDRRTTTLAIDYLPPAYKASCDLVLSEEEFIEEALGVPQDGSGINGSLARSRVSEKLLKEMAARLFEATSDKDEVAGADLPEILKDFREFRDSTNWLGFGTSQRLAEALAACEPRLQLVRLNPAMYKMVLKPSHEGASLPPTISPPVVTPQLLLSSPVNHPLSSNGKRDKSENGVSADRFSRSDLSRLRAQVVEAVKDMVAASPSPILLARASQSVVNRLGPQVLETQWAGAGSFKRLLQSAENVNLEITTQPEPGYIFDPRRHNHPAQLRPGVEDTGSALTEEVKSAPLTRSIQDDSVGEHFQPGVYSPEPTGSLVDDLQEPREYEETLPSLEEFSHRVSRVTGTPDLSPQQYAQVFRGIVIELQKIASGEKSYNTYQSSKAISEWCSEHGIPVLRNDLVLLFKAIIFQDSNRFTKQPESYNEFDLAGMILENVKYLCRRSRLELTEYEQHLLEEWLFSGLEAPIPIVENGVKQV